MNTVRKIALKNGADTLILPVTPASFTVKHGIDVQTVNITALGDIRIAGFPTLDSIKIESFFPAQAYNFSVSGYTDPWEITDKLRGWMTNRVVLRFIVTGTTINKPVLIEAVDVGENDGSNDVAYALTLAEYRFVGDTGSVYSSAAGINVPRAVETDPNIQWTCVSEPGDSLRTLAQRYFGDPEKYLQIAELNNISNAAILQPGTLLVLANEWEWR